MKEKAILEAMKAAGEPVPDVIFVGIGVGNRPNGGIAERLAGITIPFFDFTFNGAEPTDPTHGFQTVDIARQYDGLADFPLYPLNLLADLNALMGVLFVHARYDQVSLDPASPKYVQGTITQQYGDTSYVFIPSAHLPLFDIARILGVPEQVIDIVEPMAKVIVEAGYDRSIPFGQPTPLRLLPRIDLATFTRDLFAAIGVGITNAVGVVTHPAVLFSGNPQQADLVNGLAKYAGLAANSIGQALSRALAKALRSALHLSPAESSDTVSPSTASSSTHATPVPTMSNSGAEHAIESGTRTTQISQRRSGAQRPLRAEGIVRHPSGSVTQPSRSSRNGISISSFSLRLQPPLSPEVLSKPANKGESAASDPSLRTGKKRYH
jgi:hypothetical protein